MLVVWFQCLGELSAGLVQTYYGLYDYKMFIFRCNIAGNELEGWQGLPRLFKWCSATFPCVEGCAVKRFSTRKAVQARTRSKRGTPPPTGCPTATRGASAATTNDVQNTTARLSVRLSVHPLPTQRCPVIPIHAPHAWDTHWRQCGGVMDVCLRTR